MDRDEPERRVGDLERQQTSAAGEPPRHDPARSKRSDSSRHHVGTPTTATHVVCTDQQNGRYRNRDCTATWSLDGQSDTGTILGATEGDESVNVHVHGHSAYTAGDAHKSLPLALLAVGGIIVTFALGYHHESLRAARARRKQSKP